MGRVHGSYIEYDAAGDTIKFQDFANNLPNGVKKEYYAESKIKESATTKMDCYMAVKSDLQRMGIKSSQYPITKGKKMVIGSITLTTKKQHDLNNGTKA